MIRQNYMIGYYSEKFKCYFGPCELEQISRNQYCYREVEEFLIIPPSNIPKWTYKALSERPHIGGRAVDSKRDVFDKMYNSLYEKNFEPSNSILTNELRGKISISDLNDLKAHYSKYKPVLCDIERGQFNLNNVQAQKSFLSEDMTNLFDCFGSDYGDRRRMFYTVVDKYYPNNIGINDFRHVVEKMNLMKDPDSLMLDLQQTAQFYANNLTSDVAQWVLESVPFSFNIKRSPHFEESVKMFSTFISERSDTLEKSDIADMKSFIYNNEQLSLVVLEPCILHSLPIKVFFSVILPLHKSGVFYFWMISVLDHVESYKENIVETQKYYKIKQQFFSLVSKAAQDPVVRTVGTLTVATGILNYLGCLRNVNEQGTPVTNAVKSFLFSGRGLDSPVIDSTVDVLGRAAFTLSSAVSHISRSAIQGLVSGYEHITLDVTRSIDHAINERNSRNS